MSEDTVIVVRQFSLIQIENFFEKWIMDQIHPANFWKFLKDDAA